MSMNPGCLPMSMWTFSKNFAFLIKNSLFKECRFPYFEEYYIELSPIIVFWAGKIEK